MNSIAIIGANGRLGSILSTKLSETNKSVINIVRGKSKLEKGQRGLIRDIFKLSEQDISKYDCVISCYKAPSQNSEEVIAATKHLITIFSNTETKLVIAGGSGVLKDPESGIPLADSTQLQEKVQMKKAYIQGAKDQLSALKLLEQHKNFCWTYMAPSATLDPTILETGNYRFTGEQLGFNHEGQSIIGYSDYANAIISELTHLDNHNVVGVVSN
ncbi:conserved hypothetical protein [Carnobacterium maltaromaticum]|uniref:NAD(P)H-binding protein n=1 Tax=Carnobacterium maltaromaticum TaxID=2751 RepID=UPI00191BA3F2|nr:NAD(P)H-binding protein [Carnobacterium maltaromaticum]CAD5900454.1 conserved hypothetical protein [Carnobacterium maltaromaticum]